MNNNFLPYQLKKNAEQASTLATQLAQITTQLSNFPIQVPETDDTARIGRMFAYAKANNMKAVLFPKGTYNQSTQLNLDGYSDLTVIGYGATINFTSTAASANGTIIAWNITNASNLIIEGLKINIQTHTLTQQYTGIQISSSHNVYLKKVNVQNAGWVGISVYDSIAGTSYNIDIDNCIVEYCRYGISSNGNFVHIKNRTYVSNHWSQSTEATSQGSLPVWSSTPTDSNYYDGIIIKGQYWIIEDCIITDNGQSGIYSGGTSYGLIKGNTITNNWNKGVDMGAIRTAGVSSITNLTVENNICKDNKTGQIHIKTVDNSKIIGNDALTLDTSYSATPAYVVPSIIMNSDCLNNIVEDNIVVQNYTTSNGIFANSSAPKSTGNSIKDNKVIATTKYNVNFDDNSVSDMSSTGTTTGTYQFLSDVQFMRRITNVLDIDLTINGLTGFNGRNALNLNASSDNTYVQVTTNKLIKFTDAGGNPQAVNLGALTSSSSTLSGLNYFADTASIRLPRTAQTTEGYMWYDATSHSIKFYDGTTTRSINFT
jgi:parallel beta-helix repeat protein